MSITGDVIGYRVQLSENDEPVADFVFDTPFFVFGFLMLVTRHQWDGSRIHSMMGKPIHLSWESSPIGPNHHPFFVDGHFLASSPDDKEALFKGSVESVRVLPIEGRFRILAAHDRFHKPQFEKGIWRFGRLIKDWSSGDPDAARVLTIFASQDPSHEFWSEATGRSEG